MRERTSRCSDPITELRLLNSRGGLFDERQLHPDLIMIDRKRKFDPQAGVMPPVGHCTHFPFLPDQAVSSFLRAKICAPFFVLSRLTYVHAATTCL